MVKMVFDWGSGILLLGLFLPLLSGCQEENIRYPTDILSLEGVEVHAYLSVRGIS